MQSNSVSKAAWPYFRLRLRLMNQTETKRQIAKASPVESPICCTGKSPLRTEAIPLAQKGSNNNRNTLSRRFLVVNHKWIVLTNLESNANIDDELILPFLIALASHDPYDPRTDTCTCKEQRRYKHKIH